MSEVRRRWDLAGTIVARRGWDEGGVRRTDGHERVLNELEVKTDRLGIGQGHYWPPGTGIVCISYNLRFSLLHSSRPPVPRGISLQAHALKPPSNIASRPPPAPRARFEHPPAPSPSACGNAETPGRDRRVAVEGLQSDERPDRTLLVVFLALYITPAIVLAFLCAHDELREDRQACLQAQGCPSKGKGLSPLSRGR